MHVSRLVNNLSRTPAKGTPETYYRSLVFVTNMRALAKIFAKAILIPLSFLILGVYCVACIIHSERDKNTATSSPIRNDALGVNRLSECWFVCKQVVSLRRVATNATRSLPPHLLRSPGD